MVYPVVGNADKSRDELVLCCSIVLAHLARSKGCHPNWIKLRILHALTAASFAADALSIAVLRHEADKQLTASACYSDTIKELGSTLDMLYHSVAS